MKKDTLKYELFDKLERKLYERAYIDEVEPIKLYELFDECVEYGRQLSGDTK